MVWAAAVAPSVDLWKTIHCSDCSAEGMINHPTKAVLVGAKKNPKQQQQKNTHAHTNQQTNKQKTPVHYQGNMLCVATVPQPYLKLPCKQSKISHLQ